MGNPKQKLNYADLVVFDIAENQPLNNEIKQIRTLGSLSFYDSTQLHYYLIKKEEEYPNINIKILYSKNILKDEGYFKCSGEFSAPEEIVDLYKNQLLVLSIKRGDSTLLWKAIKINNKIGKAEIKSTDNYTIHIANLITNTWGEVYFYVRIPSTLQDGDEINLGLWNISNHELFVRNIKLEQCELK